MILVFLYDLGKQNTGTSQVGKIGAVVLKLVEHIPNNVGHKT